jgi:enoyl-CoA hydratase/carnithine racemase
MELILTGESINAAEARRCGLLTRVAPPDRLPELAMEIAGEMAGKSPVSLRFVKEALYNGMDLTLDQGLRMEMDLYLLQFTTADRREGITAFREKRAPQFSGR